MTVPLGDLGTYLSSRPRATGLMQPALMTFPATHGTPEPVVNGAFDEDNDFVRAYWRALYVGLTRVSCSDSGSYLIVVNSEPRLDPFLLAWFEPLDP